MVTCPPLLVAPPPTTPYVGGLFAAARFPELPTDGDSRRWECGGIQYEAESCARPVGWHEVCPGEVPAAPAKTPTLEFPLVEGTPFTALLGVECKLTGYTLEEFERRVVRAFTLCEQRTVEEIFWTGSEDNRPSLAGTAEEPSECVILAQATAPLSLTGGVAALEGYLGDNYCGVGVIHAPRTLAAYAAATNLMCNCGTAKVSTPLGTQWAFGGGYSVNTGPDGIEAPEGVAWLYATGQVSILRSEVWVNPDDLRYAFNTRTNDVTVFAERKYAITYECVCAAVAVTVGCNC